MEEDGKRVSGYSGETWAVVSESAEEERRQSRYMSLGVVRLDHSGGLWDLGLNTQLFGP